MPSALVVPRDTSSLHDSTGAWATGGGGGGGGVGALGLLQPANSSIEKNAAQNDFKSHYVKLFIVPCHGRLRLATRQELIATWRYQQAAIVRERQARRRNNACAAKLHRADLLAGCIVNIRIRQDERDPEPAVRHLRPRFGPSASPAATRRCPPRPPIWNGGDQRVDLPSLDDALVDQLPVRVVLAERWLAGHKHEIEAARRIGNRDARVKREVQVAVRLRARSCATGRSIAAAFLKGRIR